MHLRLASSPILARKVNIQKSTFNPQAVSFAHVTDTQTDWQSPSTTIQWLIMHEPWGKCRQHTRVTQLDTREDGGRERFFQQQHSADYEHLQIVSFPRELWQQIDTLLQGSVASVLFCLKSGLVIGSVHSFIHSFIHSFFHSATTACVKHYVKLLGEQKTKTRISSSRALQFSTEDRLVNRWSVISAVTQIFPGCFGVTEEVDSRLHCRIERQLGMLTGNSFLT